MKLIKGYKKQSDEFFIINKHDLFVEVRGKKIKISGFEYLDLFVHSKQLGKKKLWAVTEGITGCRIGRFNPDLKNCLEKAKDILNGKDIKDVQDFINKKVNGYLLSPRYRFSTNKNRIRYVAAKKDSYTKFIFPQVLRVQIRG